MARPYRSQPEVSRPVCDLFGQIKFYDAGRAYGFIISDDYDGQDIYFNEHALIDQDRIPRKGERVMFAAGNGAGRPLRRIECENSLNATVSDHNQLLAAIRQRIGELQLSYETVEYLSGLQSGYLTRVISDPPPKRMCPFTQFLILQALGLRVRLEEDPELIEKLRGRWTKRKLRKSVRTAMSMNRVIELTPDFMRRISRMGCEARMRKLSPERRSELARNAAVARWRQARERKNPGRHLKPACWAGGRSNSMA
jgi:cold shock CspA family protein